LKDTVISLPRILFRVPEVATMCGLSESFVYECIASGDLPAFHKGRAIRVTEAALASWVDRHTEGQG